MLVQFDVYRNGRLWSAREIGHAIFPQASTLDQLYGNVKDATHLHYDYEELDNGEKLDILTPARAEVKSDREAAVG